MPLPGLRIIYKRGQELCLWCESHWKSSSEHWNDSQLPDLTIALFCMLTFDRPTNNFFTSFKRCSGHRHHSSALREAWLLQGVRINPWLSSLKLREKSRNFTQFYSTKSERDRNMRKEYETQMEYRKHLQTFIDRWRYNANRGTCFLCACYVFWIGL